jgi:hypothetical protein
MRPVHYKMANLLTLIHAESPQDSIAKFYELEQEDACPAVPRSLGLGNLQYESRLAMANSWAILWLHVTEPSDGIEPSTQGFSVSFSRIYSNNIN